MKNINHDQIINNLLNEYFYLNQKCINENVQLTPQEERIHKFIREIDDGGANIDLSNISEVNQWLMRTRQNFDREEILDSFPNFYSYPGAAQIVAVYNKIKRNRK